MRRTRTDGWAALACLLLVAGMLCAAPANAQTPAERAEARAHFDRGLALAKSGEYDAALGAFQQAYAVVPHYGVLYNIAQAQVAAGQSAAARETFQRYLAEGGSAVDASRRAEVEALLTKLQAASTTTPAEAPLEPEPAAATESSRPMKPSEPPLSAPAHERSAPVPGTGARASASNGAEPRDLGSSRRRVAYLLGGASAVLGGVTLGHYLWNRSRYQDWQTERQAYERHPSERQRAITNDLAESISRASVVTVVLSVGASLALGSGVVLFVSSQPAPSGQSGVLDGAVGVQGTF